MDVPKVTFHVSSPGIRKEVLVHRQQVTIRIDTKLYDTFNHLLCQFSLELTGIGLSKNVSFDYFGEPLVQGFRNALQTASLPQPYSFDQLADEIDGRMPKSTGQARL
ncbi:MAG: hypothetical protein RBS57_13495 [Desulforhabdus sp.]|jgi:hypothetical protein|nr:hypothetical protein [Desulforhabdus sp.]